VAAQGDRYLVIWRGKEGLVGGTSASTPTFAGIVALLNDALISAGKPPLGFLHPWLYSDGMAGLNDITIGNNTGCGTSGFNVSGPFSFGHTCLVR